YIAHEVAERIGPRFLVSPRQMRVGLSAGDEQRRIARQHGIARIAASNPEFVLLFLKPAHRCLAAVYLEPQIIFMPGAHLAYTHRSARATLEPHEHRRKVFALHLELVAALVG